jgi:hypothetical protein
VRWNVHERATPLGDTTVGGRPPAQQGGIGPGGLEVVALRAIGRSVVCRIRVRRATAACHRASGMRRLARRV